MFYGSIISHESKQIWGCQVERKKIVVFVMNAVNYNLGLSVIKYILLYTVNRF